MSEMNNAQTPEQAQESQAGQQNYNTPDPQAQNGQPGSGTDNGSNNEQHTGYTQNGSYDNQPYNGYTQNGDYDNQPYSGYAQNGNYGNQPYSGYAQNGNYNNQPYGGYAQNGGYDDQQYNACGSDAGYNNGQYNNYGQNTAYNNGQYNAYGQNTGYGQPYGSYNQPYGQNPYANPQAAYNRAEPVREPVTNIFYYMLMAFTAASTIISIIAAKGLINNMFSSIDLDAMAGTDFASIYSSMMYSFSTMPGYSAYAAFNSLLRFAILTVSIVDIVLVHKKGYPILGLILFTILCKPGYFIWRAYVLKQKKAIPVLFTVGYVLLYIGYFIWCFSYMLNMVV